MPLQSMVAQFAIVIVYTQLYEQPGLALIAVSSITLVEACVLLHFKPYSLHSDQYLKVFNVVTRLCLSYILFVFTPFARDPGAAQKMADVFIVITIANMVVNAIYFLFPIFIKILRNIRKCIKKCKVKKLDKKLD